MSDHTCYRCHAEVEEGTAFCKQCGAPQIRVAVPEGAVVSPPLEPGTPGEVQPPAQQVAMPYSPAPLPPEPVNERVNWGDALPGALAAGALVALAWLIPFLGFLLWPLAAGVLAVLFYARRRPLREMASGMGARIGVIAGLLGFAMMALLMSLELLAFRGTGKLRQLLLQTMQQAMASNPDPAAQEAMHKLMTPEGIAVLVTFAMILFFAMFLGLGALGGVLGASLMRKRPPRV
ncbi:MAG TPA: zinc ribbon domain-containing protein [Terriglobales bacterium]|nr:zinc ribbon domain-containing protein [Terriglobales bacterium]